MNDFTSCCSAFYENEFVRTFFSDVLHPGGLELTKKLAKEAGVSATSRVLDLSCGTGETALFLAQEFGCEVTGVDVSEKNISLAKSKAQEKNLESRVHFVVGAMESLELNRTFDVIISECSLCLGDAKKTLKQIHRVLKPQGIVAITDFVTQTLPKEFQTHLLRVLCIADALSEIELQHLMTTSGFDLLKTQDLKETLLSTIEILKKRLFLAEVSGVLGKIDLSQFGISVEQGKELIDKGIEQIHNGNIGYIMIVGRKK